MTRHSFLRARLLRDGEPGATPGTAPTGGGASAPTNGQPPAPAEGNGDQPLGETGLKALQDERAARKELEKRLKKLEPLAAIADAFGGGDAGTAKTELEQIAERMATTEAQLNEERQARWRAEVAHAKGMTADQALELRGATREEFEQHADRLLSLFAASAAAAGPRAPKPDRSQGGGAGSAPANGRDAGLAEARRRFGTKTT